MAEVKIRMSQQGYDEIVEKLEYLRNVRRKEVAEKLKEARSQGDLSENAEYDAAKDEQGLMEAEILELEYKVKNAEIISEADLKDDEVGIGSKITIEELDTGDISDIQIVGSTEADHENNKISEDSPIGIAVLKKKIGAIVEVECPGGNYEIKIISINK